MKKNKLFSGRGISARTRAGYELQVQRAYLKTRIKSLKSQGLLKFSSLKDVNPAFFKAKGTVEEIQAQTEQIKKLLESPLSSAWDIKMKRGKLTPRQPAQPARPSRPPEPEPAPEPDRPSRPGVSYDEEDEDVDFEKWDEDFGDGYHGDTSGADTGGYGPEAPTTGPGAHDRYSDIMDMIPEDERDDIREEYDSQDVFWIGDTMINEDMSIDEARDAFDRQKERRLKELEPERSPEPF